MCVCVYDPVFYLEVKVLITQSCLTLCDPMDCSVGSSVHGILQARIWEWVAISSSRGSPQLRDRTQVFCIDMWILYHLNHQGSPIFSLIFIQMLTFIYIILYLAIST